MFQNFAHSELLIYMDKRTSSCLSQWSHSNIKLIVIYEQFCVEFQRYHSLWNFTQNFVPIHWKDKQFIEIENLKAPACTHFTSSLWAHKWFFYYDDVIMSAMASQITSVSIAWSTVLSGTDQGNIKSRVIGLCEGNTPVTVGFPSQRVSYEENVSIWWRHHVDMVRCLSTLSYRYFTDYIFICILLKHMIKLSPQHG